jgi:hypothetical protein
MVLNQSGDAVKRRRRSRAARLRRFPSDIVDRRRRREARSQAAGSEEA